MVDALLLKHSQDKEKGYYQIISADNSTFQVVKVTSYFEDMEKFQTLFVVHKLLDLKGSLSLPIKILSLLSRSFECDLVFYAILRGQWSNLLVEKGDIVQIFGKFSEDTHALVVADAYNDDGYFFNLNFVIVEPSLLLTPTTITASFPCYRRVILQNIFRQKEDVSLAMTVGTMMHELWETMVTKPEEMSSEKAEELIDSLIKDQINVLYFLKANLQSLRQDMKKFVPFIREWTDKYIGIKFSIYLSS